MLWLADATEFYLVLKDRKQDCGQLLQAHLTHAMSCTVERLSAFEEESKMCSGAEHPRTSMYIVRPSGRSNILSPQHCRYLFAVSASRQCWLPAGGAEGHSGWRAGHRAEQHRVSLQADCQPGDQGWHLQPHRARRLVKQLCTFHFHLLHPSDHAARHDWPNHLSLAQDRSPWALS